MRWRELGGRLLVGQGALSFGVTETSEVLPCRGQVGGNPVGATLSGCPLLLPLLGGLVTVFIIALGALGGCTLLGSTKPLVKIGLVAPFEGAHRHLGYNVLYAVKLAIAERNAAGGVAGYNVILVALDDSNDPTMAPRRARELIVDPLVVGVIGHLSPETTRAAMPEYRAAQLACISPLSVTLPATFSPLDFTSSYQQLANQEPSPQAMAAYVATQKLLTALQDIHPQSALSRRAVLFETLNKQ